MRQFAHQRILANRAGAGLGRLLAKALSAKRPELTRHELRIHGLPRQLDGLRLLHVTDLHVRDGSGPSAWLPEIAASLTYDLTLYTGDFIDGDDDVETLTTLLSAMPAGPPSYAVLGNHDYWSAGREPKPNDMARLESALSEVGVTVLRNSAALARGGRIYVAGVDDPVTGLDDASAAMAAVPPDAACVLLAHSPDVLLRLAGHKPMLVLAGHTHGGQVRLPVLGPVFNVTSLPRRLAMGYHVHEGIPLFVSRGVGYSGADIRFRCPPQIALLELRASAALRG